MTQQTKSLKYKSHNRRLNVTAAWDVLHTKEVFTSVHKYKTALGGLRTNTRMQELPDDIFMPDSSSECAKKYSSVTSLKQHTPYYSPGAERWPIRFFDPFVIAWASRHKDWNV